MHLARRELDADRYVEVVKYLESLPYSRRRGGLHGSRGLEKSRTHKSRRRSHITGYTKKTAASPERSQLNVTERMGSDCTRIQIDIIVEIPIQNRENW